MVRSNYTPSFWLDRMFSGELEPELSKDDGWGDDTTWE